MTLLRVEQLSKEFGGVRAVADLQFSIAAGQVFSIIGPNGAGKTTLLNLLTGVYVPSTGRIWFEERNLTGRAPYEYAACGIARTFQNLQVFFNMISGFYPPNSGDVLLNGKSILGLKPNQICKLGMTRTFQIVTACEDLEATVQELINEANDRGGKDNITVVLARLDPPEDA